VRDTRLRMIDAELRERWLEADRDLIPGPSFKGMGKTAFASLPEIQSIADADTLLVFYLLAEPASFAWTMDRHAVMAHVLPGKEHIERLARRVVAALPHSHEVSAKETAARVMRELSEAILAPLAERLAG